MCSLKELYFLKKNELSRYIFSKWLLCAQSLPQADP